MRALLLLFTFIISTVVTLKCTVCEFKLLPPYNSACNETCEGDVCFIVVNKFFNGTINAGCMHLREDDSFENEAICQRGTHDNRCACSTKDNCNNPHVSIASYTFVETPLLEDYQWLPQIQPPMPSLQPIIPPEDIRDMNETATELENGVENDLSHELDSVSNGSTTQIQRNQEENEELLTVTTTIGLNVRDQTQRINTNELNNDVETLATTERSFTPGQGSVEVTKVSQEATSPTRMDTVPRNLTVSDGSEGPNSSGSFNLLLITVIPILVQKIF